MVTRYVREQHGSLQIDEDRDVRRKQWEIFHSARKLPDRGVPSPDNCCWPTWSCLNNSFRRQESRGDRGSSEVTMVHPLYDDIRRVDGRVGTRAPSFISAITADVSSRDGAIVSLVSCGGTKKFRRRKLERRGRGNIARLLTFTAATYSSSVVGFRRLNRFYLAQIESFYLGLVINKISHWSAIS